MKEIKGFMFLRGYRDAINELPEPERLKAYETICNYAFDGILPEKDEENIAITVLFKCVQPSIDKSIRNYQAKCENGAKGG